MTPHAAWIIYPYFSPESGWEASAKNKISSKHELFHMCVFKEREELGITG